MPKRRRRGMERRIARERMEVLFRLAEKEGLEGRMSRARRYVELARRLGMRYNVQVPREFKRRFCRKCLSYLVPSVNARVRVGRSRVAITCLTCGAIERFPYRAEKGMRRESRRPAQ